jgi:hypothetical protein
MKFSHYDIFIQEIDKRQLYDKTNEKSIGKPNKFRFPFVFALESPRAVPDKTVNQSDNVTHYIRNRKRQ